MKTYSVYYRFDREYDGEPAGTLFVGSGCGETEEQALADFRFWHDASDLEVVGVEEYK